MSAIHELDETDPVLGHLLELLKAAPDRDHRSARQGRSKFLAELDELFPPETVHSGVRRGAAAGSAQAPSAWKELVSSMFRPPRLVWAPITVGLTVLFFLVFTGMATVRVAEAALPGDALYPLKTSIEQAELAVVTDPVDEAALNLKYAERRLVEANALAANGRLGDAQALVVESDARMKSAYATMLTVQRTDPERANRLRKMVQYRLTVLNGLVSTISASASPTLTPVLQSVMTSVNSMVSADVPAIDPASPPPTSGGQPGNTNGGGDTNTDSNDNANTGSNENDNDDENANDNDNTNDAPANNNGDGPDNNNGGGQESNNGNGGGNNGGGQENNNGNGGGNNGGGQGNNNGNGGGNGGGRENNNGNGGGNSGDGNDNNSGGGQEGNNGNGGGDDNPGDGNNGGGNDGKDKPKKNPVGEPPTGELPGEVIP